MGLPGHRRTSSHKRRRASHFALKKHVLATCEKCQQPIAPHRACRNCGFYKGREVVSTAKKTVRLLKKSRTAPAAHEHNHDHDHDHDHDHAHEASSDAKESPKS